MQNNTSSVMLFDKKFVANSVRNFLKCPSCRNDFSTNFQHDHVFVGTHAHTRSNRPILLPCGHTICENCIQQNYKNLVCPECSRPLPVPKHLWGNFTFRKIFELNFFLVGIMRHLSYYRSDGLCDTSVLLSSENDRRIDRKSKKTISLFKCGECEEAYAVGICNKCNVNYCKKCFQTVHKNSKVLKSHSLTAFDTQNSKLHFQKPRPKTCHRHHQICDRYCNKCRKICCQKCIKADHLTHNHISLMERNEKQIDNMFAVLETVKQSREKCRRAQREIRSVDSQLQDYATQTLEDIAHYFWEMHGLLQLEFQKIVQNFSESCATPQKQMRTAYDAIGESMTALNNMRSCLESFQNPPTDIDLANVVQNVTKKLKNVQSEVKITKIDNNPFTFKKLGNFKRDLQNFFSYKYENPNISICIGPVYANWQQNIYDKMAENKDVSMLNTSLVNTSVLYDPAEKTIDIENDTMHDISTILDEIMESQKKTTPPDFSPLTATISYIKSPTYFFLQYNDVLPKLKELAQKYEHVQSHDLVPKNITINKLYMGFIESTGQWQRIVVTKMIDENLFRTLLVDIGSNIEMKRKDIRKLDHQYADIAYAAVPCSLYNLEPVGNTWPPDVKDIMMDITRGKPVHAYTFGKIKNEILSVDLLTTYGDEPISIRESFLYMGLAREKPGSTKISSVIPKMHPVVSITQQFMKFNLRVGDTYPVRVTHVENPTEFFIVRADHESLKDALNADLNLVYNNKKKLNFEVIYQASLKMCCAVRFKNIWYRGSVEEIEGNGLVRVRFVDEGKTEVVKWNHLYHMEPKFRNEKEFALRCSLYELEPLQKNSYAWSSEAIHECKLLMSNPNINLCVDQIIQNIYRVTLHIQKKNVDINIGAALVRMGHAISTGPSTQTHEGPTLLNNFNVNIQKQELLETLTTQQQQKKNYKPLERVPIKIVHIVNPGEFYFYLTSLEEGVKQFHKQLQSSQEANKGDSDFSMDLNNVKVWSVGDHCLVHTAYRSSLQLTNSNDKVERLQKQREWFRAKVVGANAHDTNGYEKLTFTVFLRDRGVTISEIKSKQLRPISHAWDSVSNSVQRCHLACLKPTDESTGWSMSATDCLKHNFNSFNQILATRQGNLNTDTNSIPVFLWGMSSESTDALAPSVSKYSNINRILMSMGLACKSEPIVAADQMSMIMDMGVDSNQISLDEWYKKNCAPAFLDALERITVNDPIEEDVIVVDDEEPVESLELLSDLNMTPTWGETAPAAWLKSKDISKTLFTAYPTYVNHSAVVFLHEADDRSFLNTMCAEMMKAYKDIPYDNNKSYLIGQPCVVKYHLDGGFYRGIVISTDNRNEEYEVQFVDYGNEETAKQDELRPFAPFRNLNSFASKYRFEGIRPPNGEKNYSLGTLDIMHKLLVDKLVSVRVQTFNVIREIPYCSIRVGAEDFAETLIRDGRVEYSKFRKKATRKGAGGKRALQLGINFPGNEINEDTSITERCLVEENENANIESKTHADLETVEKRTENLIENEDHDDNDSNESSFELEQPKELFSQLSKSTFKCSDFNGDIVGPTCYNFHQVQEKDYGNGENEDNSINKENPYLSLLEEVDADVTVLEESFISNYWKESSAAAVKIDNDKDDDENELALQWSHIKALQCAKSESSCDFDVFRPQDASTSLSYFSDLQMFKWPKLPTNVRSFLCSVNAVVSPTMLYIFPHLKDFKERDKEIKCLIKQIIITAKPLANFTPNTVCLACYSNDNCWYRAIIRSYDADALEANVLFVDYWNIEKVSIKNLKECPIELLNFPLRTLKVQFFGIKPSLRMRERDICQALKNELKQYDELFVQVQNHSDQMNNISSMNEPLDVYIFKSENSPNTIYYELLKQKFYTSNI